VVGIIKEMPDSQAKADLTLAYSESLRMIWVTILALSGFSLLLSVLMKGYTLNQVHETQQGLVERGRTTDGEKVAPAADDVEESSKPQPVEQTNKVEAV
jgi:hypothetical protein